MDNTVYYRRLLSIALSDLSQSYKSASWLKSNALLSLLITHNQTAHSRVEKPNSYCIPDVQMAGNTLCLNTDQQQRFTDKSYLYMSQVTELWLSCYLV